MKFINYYLHEKLISNNVEIYPNPINEKLTLNLYDKFYMEESKEYITHYCHKLSDISFNSVLIGGLGLGIIPYYLINNNFNDIEVVEIDSNLINLINKMGYLPNAVIHNYDATTYTTFKKYDLIIMDIWWLPDDTLNKEKDIIINNYSNNLNSNGKIYIPIIDELI
jgi:spermidine synthase